MRILSKARKIFCAALALCAGELFSAADLSPLQSLLNAETGFAQMSAQQGTRPAFLANLADDAIVFEPGPVNGKQLWLKRQPSDSRLTWQPLFADVSRAGDIGYTTGPWEFRKTPADAKDAAFGQFLSIWRQKPEGTWKVIIDGGIDTARAAGNSSSSQPPPVEPAAEGNPDVKSARRAFAAAEREFDEASQKDAGAAIINDASNGVRVYRSGKFPAVGRDAARLMLGYDHGKTKTTRAGGGFSRSGDMGYSYGDYSTERLDGIEHGSYIAIWKAAIGGDWKLAIDFRVRRPVPTVKNK